MAHFRLNRLHGSRAKDPKVYRLWNRFRLILKKKLGILGFIQDDSGLKSGDWVLSEVNGGGGRVLARREFNRR
jgi:hypothetical protein